MDDGKIVNLISKNPRREGLLREPLASLLTPQFFFFFFFFSKTPPGFTYEEVA